MKNLILLIVFSLTIMQSSFAENFKDSVTVKVNGMVCSFCAQGIEKKFKEEESVKNIKVNLDNMQVSIDLKKDREISKDKIKKIIEDSGFAFEGIIDE